MKYLHLLFLISVSTLLASFLEVAGNAEEPAYSEDRVVIVSVTGKLGSRFRSESLVLTPSGGRTSWELLGVGGESSPEVTLSGSSEFSEEEFSMFVDELRDDLEARSLVEAADSQPHDIRITFTALKGKQIDFVGSMGTADLRDGLNSSRLISSLLYSIVKRKPSRISLLYKYFLSPYPSRFRATGHIPDDPSIEEGSVRANSEQGLGR